MNHFQLPRFYPIIDTAFLAKVELSPMTLAEVLVNCGVQILQYRHKDGWKQAHFDEAKAMANLCRDNNVQFVINDRADYANLLKAGLHVGQDDLQPVAARRIMSNAVLGFSTHNAMQLRRASDEPADYLSLGPIFATQSKDRPDPVVGPDGFKTVRRLTTKPLVAIGGITLANVQQVLSCGADSVAVISGLVPEGNGGKLEARIQDWFTATQQTASPGT